MSELMNAGAVREDSRWRLLTTVSALTLLAAACPAGARADDAERPTVWIELGGQLETMSQAQDRFVAPFELEQQPLPPFPFPVRYHPGTTPSPGPTAPFDRAQPLEAQQPPNNSFGGEARISFEPEGTNWIFSASLRYGRSNGDKQLAQQTEGFPPFAQFGNNLDALTYRNIVRFTDADASYRESHVIADFQVGKDVGLGMFGRNATSVFNAGVRFAQFTSKSQANITAAPNLQPYHSHHTSAFFGPISKYTTRFQSYLVRASSERSFRGVGPSLSWNGSAPLAGNADRGELVLDWGVNGALLFGRQKAATAHRTYAYTRYQTAGGFYPQRTTHYKNNVAHTRSHAVTVPNIGAFAGLSARYANARVSFGYRADFFFGAMDAGIDARHTQDVNFHGPFAKLSIGLGG